MIFRIVNKLNFIKNLNKKKAVSVINVIIALDEILWRIRLAIFILFLGKKNKFGKALFELRKTGVAIIPNFYSDQKVSIIKKECFNLMDQISENKINEPNIEKVSNQIKIKGLNELNKFFRDIGRDIKMSIITIAYHLAISRPYLIYNLFHDGTCSHPIFLKDKKTESETIAGVPHIDLYLHKLRICLALENVNNQNGPTVCYKNSMHLNFIKENHLNLALEKFEFHNDKYSGHYVNEDKINKLENNSEKFRITANKGDLILIDLKTVHHQTPLKQGERHFLWFYF
jgi:hypothetical protein